jgi:hypothetical protein
MQYLAETNTSPSPPEKLPARVEPMMIAHLALTGDVTQHREWKDRVEAILQMQAIEREQDPEMRRLLSRTRVWKQIRAAGKTGAITSMALGTAWMTWLIPVYALDHGFGWLAALSYLLPVPIAWRIGRKLWEKAALQGMKDNGPYPSLLKRMNAVRRGLVRSMVAGFSFGFTLVFLQGLISWFMTPAPTLGLELYLDALIGAMGGVLAAGASTVLTPLVSRPPP